MPRSPSFHPWPVLLALWLLVSAAPAAPGPGDGDGDERVRIGILSHRGEETTYLIWSPTADYLSESIPGYRFEVVPLAFDGIEPAVAAGSVDFILANPGIYVRMEVAYRISRIATLNKIIDGEAYNAFGGVLITRADRTDIDGLQDIRGKRLLAVAETSLGGFQMAWREFHKAGIDLRREVGELRFAGTHDGVVNPVLQGSVDVGIIRTDILASLAASGEIDLAELKILNRQSHQRYPFPHSTALYPEWPFSKLQHTSNDLAQKVAVALLRMQEHNVAAEWGDYGGWTVPLDYQPVHELLRDLRLPPYDQPGEFTVMDAVRKYWYWLVTTLVFLLVMGVMTTWVVRLNRALARTNRLLQQQHRLILDSVADGIYGVDLAGRATFVNKAMQRITGWSAEELLGRPQHALLHHSKAGGSPNPAAASPVRLTFSDNRARYIEEDVFRTRDGRSIPVEYSCTPLRDADDKTIGSVVVFRDIGERKAAEAAARKHQRELAHVARLSTMGEVASGIAHELNQPLTAIAASADASLRLLETGAVPGNQLSDILERISLQARHAGGVIQQMRQFVRKDEVEHTRVDLNVAIGEVLVLARHEIAAADVSVSTELEPGLPPVTAQHIQIDQVLLNLVKNAIEAMAGGARRELDIRTTLNTKGMVVVSVADSGPGIDPELEKRLFTPFTTTKAQGMGLGLSISEGIIAAHHGRLYLDREAGQGAVFRFTLPLGGI